MLICDAPLPPNNKAVAALSLPEEAPVLSDYFWQMTDLACSHPTPSAILLWHLSVPVVIPLLFVQEYSQVVHGVVLLAADRHSTSSSGYRASLWGPCPDLYFSSFLDWQLLFLFPMASSLTRGRVCSLECLHSLVRLLTTNNHTLPSHLRLCSLSVASYGSQGLRWRYSNPPPHGVRVVHYVHLYSYTK
jgi:hypothetical protein